MSENLLTISQVSTMLGVHPDTLRRWEKQDLIHPVRFGNRKDRRYSIDEVNSLLEKGISPIVSEVKDNSQYINACSTVLFDVSETLISPFPSRGAIMAKILSTHGYTAEPLKIDIEYLRLYNEWEKEKLFSDESISATTQNRRVVYSKLNADIIKKVLEVNLKNSQLLSLGQEVFDKITTDSDCWKVNDNVVAFLVKLQSDGKKLGIVDNWNKNFITILKDLDLAKYFEVIISGGELGMRKPKKEIFVHALNLIGSKATDCIYIGNRYIDDVIGPQNAGIQPLLYDPMNTSTYIDLPKFSNFGELL